MTMSYGAVCAQSLPVVVLYFEHVISQLQSSMIQQGLLADKKIMKIGVYFINATVNASSKRSCQQLSIYRNLTDNTLYLTDNMHFSTFTMPYFWNAYHDAIFMLGNHVTILCL